MKTNSRISNALWMAFAVFALVALLLQTVAVLTDYESAANYFRKGAVFPVLSYVSALIAALCGSVAAGLTEIKIFPSLFSKKASFYPSAVGFLLAGVGMLIQGKDAPARIAEAENKPWPIETTLALLAMIAGVLLLLAAVYTVLSALPRCRQKKDPLAVLGFSVVLGTILMNAYYYFDVTMEMNAPIKVCVQLGLLCVTLCATGELRDLLQIQKPRMYLMLTVWTLAAGAISALPVCVAYLTSKMTRLDYLSGAILILLCAAVQIPRLCRLLGKKSAADESPDTSVTEPAQDELAKDDIVEE